MSQPRERTYALMTNARTAVHTLLDSATRRGQLVALAVGFVCLGAFLAVADSVPEHEGLTVYDLPVARWFALHRSVELGDLGLLLAKVTSPAALAVGLLVAGGVLWLRGFTRELVLLAGAVVAAETLTLVVKYAEHRSRPTAPINLAPESEPSFPSGHVMVAATALSVAVVLCWSRLSRIGRVIAVAAAGLGIGVMVLDRLVVGAHWLTDVLASLALAGVVTAVVVAVGVTWPPAHER